MTTATVSKRSSARLQGASILSHLPSTIYYLLSTICYLLSAAAPVAASAATVRLSAPDDGALYDLHSPCVKEFLEHWEERGVKPPRPKLTEEELAQSNRQFIAYQKWREAGSPKDKRVKLWEDRFNFYMHNAWTRPLMKRAEEEEKTFKPFQWTVEGGVTNVVVEFSTTPDFKDVLTEKVASDKGRHFTSIRPSYLLLGTRYWWRIRAMDREGAEVLSDVRSFTTSDKPPRLIGRPSENMRDLGGGVNADGVPVRQGLLYRGQAPWARASLSFLQDRYVNKLGIKTQLDLRGRDEFEARSRQWGETDLAKVGIRHEFHTIIPYHVNHPDVFTKLPAIFAILATETNYPVYFNCAVGSDRTGTLAFLLDGVIGRDDKYFYDDYELPSFNQNTPRYRYCRKGSELFLTFAKGGKPIREAVVAYLLKRGITQEQIDAIRKVMLEVPPAARGDSNTPTGGAGK